MEYLGSGKSRLSSFPEELKLMSPPFQEIPRAVRLQRMGDSVSFADSVTVVLIRARLGTPVFHFLCEDLMVRLKAIFSHDSIFKHFVQNGTGPLRKH